MKKSVLFFSILLLVCLNLYTQAPQRCHTAEHMEHLYEINPELKEAREKYLAKQNQIKYDGILQKATTATITIPVVVHVVYANSTENISDAQVLSQIAVLNADFSASNSDIGNVPSVWQSDVGNPEIQFCLAQVDPNGNPTSGINRVQTNVSSFNTNDNIKFTSSGGVDAWDVTKYFNIWVGDLGGGLLGYAEFPTGFLSNTYGVVCNYWAFGTTGVAQSPFNKGRTATHEIGHCFNLSHIWGDAQCGNDNVSDTPQADGPNYDCPSFPTISSSCGNGPNGDMFMNYMDYVNDACMYMFTNGQASRMTNVLNSNPWNVLQNSTVCGGNNSPTDDAGISAITSPGASSTICSNNFIPIITLKNFGTNTLTSVTIKYKIDNNSEQSYSWTGSLTAGGSETVVLPNMSASNGSHSFTAYTQNPNGNSDDNSGNDQSVVSFTINATAGGALPFSEDFEGSFPPSDWSIIDPDNDNLTWQQNTSYSSSGSKSTEKDNYNSDDAGSYDYLITPEIDLSSSNNPSLSFDLAYESYSDPSIGPYVDTLFVLATVDCGETWLVIYAKYGADLSTTDDIWNAGEFFPTANDWRTETISLTNLDDFSNVSFAFANLSGYGNHLYIDRIEVSGVTSSVLNGDKWTNVQVFPNPANDILNIKASGVDINRVEIHNLLGEMVFSTEQLSGINDQLDISHLSTGTYSVIVYSESNQDIFKIVKN